MFAISRVGHQADLGRDCASALSLGRGSHQRPGRVLTRAVRPWPVIRKTNPVIWNLNPAARERKPVPRNLNPVTRKTNPVILNANPVILNLIPVILNLTPVILNLIQDPSNPTATPDPAIVDCFAR